MGKRSRPSGIKTPKANCVKCGRLDLLTKQNNRDFIGIEKNPEYCEIVKKEILSQQTQSSGLTK